MNILFLTIGKMNNLDDQGIYTDLFKFFSNMNHNVYIISSAEKRRRIDTNIKTVENIRLIQTKIGNITKTNIVEKGLSLLTINKKYQTALEKYFKRIKFDLIIYSTPPITFNKIVSKIKKRDNATTYLLLKDIFPQNAVDLKMFSKKSPFYWYFRFVEKKLYKISDYIGCMSDANVNFVKTHNNYLNPIKIEVCPNSISPIFNDIDKNMQTSLKIKYNIPLDKTLFIYGGNLGKPQGIDFIISCIKDNETKKDSFILIVGSGTEYTKLDTFINKNNIKNTKLLHFLPKDEFETLVVISDVGLIFLDYRFTIPNFPSRLLSYMQAGLPILAATDTNTDIGDIIVKNNFGFWTESKDIKQFSAYVDLFCVSEERKIMGDNSKKYLLDNYTVENSYKIIMNHFKDKSERSNAKQF